MTKYLIGGFVVLAVIFFAFTYKHSAVPTSSPTPIASNTVKPSPTPTPIKSTIPGYTATPTAKPSPTKTPTPTATPVITPTPVPQTPTPTSNPTATPTPSPTATPTPSPTATPVPEPIITSVDNGNGSQSVKAGDLVYIHGLNFSINGVKQIQSVTIGSYTTPSGFSILNSNTIQVSSQTGSYGTYSVSIKSLDGTVSNSPNSLTVNP